MAKNIYATLSMNAGNFFSGAKEATASVKSLKETIQSANSSVKSFGNGAASDVSKWKTELGAVKVELANSDTALKNITAEQDKANAAFYKAKSHVGEIAVEQQKVSQQLKEGTISTEQAKQKQEQLNQKMSEATKELEKTKTARQQVKVKIDSAKAAVSEAKAKQGELNAKIQEGENKIKQEKSAQDKLNDSIEKGIKNKKSGNQSEGGITGAAQVISGSALASVGSAVGRAAGGFTKDSIKSASEYGGAVAKVSTIADTSIVPINKLSSGIKQISSATGTAATELAEAAYQAISAGVDTANAVNFVEVANKAAIGGYTDTATAVDGLSSVLNTYGMAATQAAGLGNQFLITQNKGKTTFGELAGSIGQVAPVAKSAGVGVNELLSSVAALTANGIGTSQAMTGIKSALSNIIKPTADASKTAQQLGLDFSVSALQSKGFVGFLQEIKDKTGGNIETMGKLFGSVEGLNSILTLTGDGGMALINETLSEMSTNTTALDDAFSTMQDSPAAKFERLNTSLENLKTSLGDTLAEPLSKLADFASGAVKAIEPMAPLILGVATSLGAIGLISSVAGVITTISGALTALGAAGTVAVASFIWIPLLIGGVVTAIALVATHWDTIKEKAGQCWEAIKGFFGNIGGWFGEKWNAVKEGAMNLWNGVQEKWNSVKDKASEIWNGVKEKCGGAIDGIKNFISPKLDAVKQAYNEHGGGIKGIAAGAMEGIKQYYSTGFDALNTLTGGKLENVKQSIQTGFQVVKTIGTNALSDMKAAYEQSGGGIKGVFSGIMAGAQSIWSQGFDLLNIITGGKAGEILGSVTSAFENIKNAISNAINAAKDIVFNIFESIKSKVSAVWEGIKGIIKTPHIVQNGTISIAGISTPIPKLGIEWNAKGGIFRRPTVLPSASGFQGVGEAGSEAILPLELFWSKLRRFTAEANKSNTSDRTTGGNRNEIKINIYAQNKSMHQVVNELIPELEAALCNM